MCYYVGAKWLWWVVCVCVYVGWVLLAVQVWKCVGGKRCVDLETQKEGKKSTPKGREAEVTSTVGRSCRSRNQVETSRRKKQQNQREETLKASKVKARRGFERFEDNKQKLRR